MHDYGLFKRQWFNLTHTVNALSFGVQFPGKPASLSRSIVFVFCLLSCLLSLLRLFSHFNCSGVVNPLDGAQKEHETAVNRVYQYYVKVVPTVYKSLRGLQVPLSLLVYMFISIHLFISLHSSFYLYVYISIYLSTLVYLFMSIHICILYPSIYISIYLSLSISSLPPCTPCVSVIPHGAIDTCVSLS